MKHKGRHIWESHVGEMGQWNQWFNQRNKEWSIATITVDKICKKCGLNERELKVIAEVK